LLGPEVELARVFDTVVDFKAERDPASIFGVTILDIERVVWQVNKMKIGGDD